MPRPSIQAQLQKAIDAGDLVKAKELVEKMKVPPKKKTKKPSPKIVIKETVEKSKSVNKPKEEEKQKRKQVELEEIDLTNINNDIDDEDDEDDTIVIGGNEDDDDDDEDSNSSGKTRSRKHKVGNKLCTPTKFPIIKNRPNNFVDDFSLAPKDLKENSPQWAKAYGTPRIKQQEPRKKQKVKIKCGGCGKIDLFVLGASSTNDIYITSLIQSIRDGSVYQCEKCNNEARNDD